MEKQTAEALAKKGYAIIKSAAKSGVAAISHGVASVRKGYSTKHEADVLAQLKAQGLHPAEHLHAALRKLNFLYLSGYEHELQAVAQQAAKRLTDVARSTVPLDALMCMGAAVYAESLKVGDFQQGTIFQGLQDFLNKARMGSNHFDRDKLSHDLYYSTLYIVEEYEGDLKALEKLCREVVAHVISTAPAPDITSQPKANDLSNDPQVVIHAQLRPYYIRIDAFWLRSDAKWRGYSLLSTLMDSCISFGQIAAKACFYYSMALNTAAQEREDKRLKALREAEALVHKEQEKVAQSARRNSSPSFPR